MKSDALMVPPSDPLIALRALVNDLTETHPPDDVYSAVVAVACETTVIFDDLGCLNVDAPGPPECRTTALALLAMGHLLKGRTPS
jgi:hypothetical protein